MAASIKELFSPVDSGFTIEGNSKTLSLSGGGEDLVALVGFMKAPGTGRTLTSADFGTQAFTQDQIGPEVNLISFYLQRVALSIKNASIPTVSSAISLVWAGTTSIDFTGIGLHLSGIDQTNPYVDQSGTAGIQEQAFSSSVPTDLTFSCGAGDIVVYVIANSTLDPGTITNFTRVNRGALGGGSTGDSTLDEGATYYWIPGSAQTDVTIPAPIGSASGYHVVQVYKAAAPDVTAPTLSSPTASSITSNGCTPQVSTDEANGTVYMVVVPDGDAPSVAQIKAGQNSSGGAALASANQAVTATGVQTFAAVTGLSSSTNYELYFVHTDASSNDSTASTIGFATIAPSPSIDSVDSNVTFGGTINFTVSDFETLTSWTLSDGVNTINLTNGGASSADLGGLGNSVNRLLTGTVTLEVGDGTNFDTANLTLDPPTGYSSVLLTSGFDTGIYSFLYNYTGTPAIGDEFLYVTADVTLNSDGSWEAPDSVVTTIYGIDASDGVMESFDLITGDAVPDVFSFTDLTGQVINTQIESSTFNVSGIDTTSPISITSSYGMEYQINSGGYTTTAGVVSNGDTIQLRVTTSGAYETEVNGTLDIGGITDTWNVTTMVDPAATNLRVGSSPVLDIKYCTGPGTLIDVEMQINGTVVWPEV